MVHKLTSIFTGDDVGNLNNATSRMRTAAPEINKFKNLPKINSGIGENIKSIGDALKSISEGTKSIGGVQWQNIWNFVTQSNPDSVKETVSAIQKRAQELSRLKRIY